MALLSLFPNLINLILCLYGLNKRTRKKKDSFPIVFSIIFVLGSILAFTISMIIQGDYLDFIGHILVYFGCTFSYWLIASIMIANIRISQNNVSQIWRDIVQISIVLFFPVLVWLWISGLNLKIGG